MTTLASHGPNGATASSSTAVGSTSSAQSASPSASVHAPPSSSALAGARADASAARDAQADRGLGPPALPSAAAIALAHASRTELERAMQRGETPEVDALIGWEFRGINTTPPGSPPIARLAGIQKFVKGMFRAADGRAMGYNSPVVQNALDGRWHTRPSDESPRRFGFYALTPVDPTSRDNHYLHAILIDYGKGGNARWDVTSGLRDYLVQVDANNPDLFLGKAYAAIGPARLPLGFFVLERFRRGPAAVERR
jgi:hypothetical protein